MDKRFLILSYAFIKFFIFFPFSVYASSSLPAPDRVGNIPTLNGMGVMCIHEGWLYSCYFEEIQPGDHILDIGCAYGHTVLKAAQKGAFVLANDLSSSQLDVLKETVKNKSFKNKITYQAGHFLNQTYPCNTYDRILIASVLHFMSPLQIRQTINKIARLLKPGGKVYILTASPFPYFQLSPLFKEEYERKIKLGDEWPGYFTQTSWLIPQLAGSIPEKCTFCELKPLVEQVKKERLTIIEARYESSSYKPAEVNPMARDFVNIIAQKPF